MPFILRCTINKLGNKLLTILLISDFLSNPTSPALADPSHGLGSVDVEGAAAYIGAPYKRVHNRATVQLGMSEVATPKQHTARGKDLRNEPLTLLEYQKLN